MKSIFRIVMFLSFRNNLNGNQVFMMEFRWVFPWQKCPLMFLLPYHVFGLHTHHLSGCNLKTSFNYCSHIFVSVNVTRVSAFCWSDSKWLSISSNSLNVLHTIYCAIHSWIWYFIWNSPYSPWHSEIESDMKYKTIIIVWHRLS